MAPIFEYIPRLPNIRDLPLQAYPPAFSLDGLVVGVDNIRFDVFLSPTFCSSTAKAAASIVAKHTETENAGTREAADVLARETHNYKQYYKELMTDAIHRAKGLSEPQIDYLAQTVMMKVAVEQIREQYDQVIGNIKAEVRKYDLASYSEKTAAPKLKEKLSTLLQDRELLMQKAGMELFGHMLEIHEQVLGEVREAAWGHRARLFSDMLRNPMLHVNKPQNDDFMIEEYDLCLGRRIEDPDKYDALLFQIKRLLNHADLKNLPARKFFVEKRGALPPKNGQETEKSFYDHYDAELDSWIRQVDNITLLFDYVSGKAHLKDLKKSKADRRTRKAARLRIKKQKKLFNYFYKRFNKLGLVKRILATYCMKSLYSDYCPPLVPLQVMQYPISPKTRRVVKKRMKRLYKLYGKSFSLMPLTRKMHELRSLRTGKKREYFMRFLKAFARFHRDAVNYKRVTVNAMERINLISDERLINLSRENNTLYEFLLPHEQVEEKRKVINHVVIKADVRGSTDITHLMNQKGLNPASFFSLNFFDPISDILSEYGARKVFIEGDAIILSIFEEENSTSDWYAVARACGIAIKILMIIRQYNKKSRKYNLPILELGVGISFRNHAPTFLFDGNNRIMISPAINQADRLSGCSKVLRKVISKNKSRFNLYVYQSATEKERAATADETDLRYNLNGIELNPEGFEKLSREIVLKPLKVDLPGFRSARNRFYSGKFPTKSGRYQRLILRESPIPMLNPDTRKVKGLSNRSYYEVCTDSRLYQMFQRHK